MALIRAWLAVVPGGGGVPQGSPISPLLSNVYLDAFDDTLLRRGLGLVRYADNLAICCASEPDTDEARGLADAELGRLGLRLNAGAQITSFAKGFDFLGRSFLGRLVLPTAKVRDAGRIRWRVGGGGATPAPSGRPR